MLNIKKMAPNVEVILLTAHGNIPDGVQAIKNGAFDYITKGDDNNKIIPLISRAVEKAKMNHLYIGSHFLDVQHQIYSVSIRKKNIA